MTLLEKDRTVDPSRMTPEEESTVRTAQKLVMEALDHSRAAALTLSNDRGEEGPSIKIPPSVLKVIGQLLGLMSTRQAFSFIPNQQELTTIEAANLLNVSRPFLVAEMKANRIKYRMVGTHRRITFEDLDAYAKTMRKQQENALEKMAANARELGLDY